MSKAFIFGKMEHSCINLDVSNYNQIIGKWLYGMYCVGYPSDNEIKTWLSAIYMMGMNNLTALL